MLLDQLFAEIEDVIARQAFDAGQETISLLLAVTREISSRQERQDAHRVSLLRHRDSEGPGSDARAPAGREDVRLPA